jgi:hypothetical protein
MKRFPTAFEVSPALLVALGILSGCGTTDEGGSPNVSANMYYGVGLYDPWYYGGYYPPDVVITPPGLGERPPGGWAARPAHPIAEPRPGGGAPSARPMPSIPSGPRPSLRR